MRRSVSLNADVGEGGGHDRELIPLLDRASIACGAHAGGDRSMRAAVELALRHGVRIGAHPSWPDRAGFGRRSLALPPAAAARLVRAQVRRLAAVAAEQGARLEHVKLHGALYHDASARPDLARALARVIRAAGRRMAWLGPPGTAQARAARRFGIPFVREGFADRRYARGGGLVPRGRPGAVLRPAAAVRQARRLAARFDTLCVHSDTAGCVAIARALRA